MNSVILFFFFKICNKTALKSLMYAKPVAGQSSIRYYFLSKYANSCSCPKWKQEPGTCPEQLFYHKSPQLQMFKENPG